MILKCREVVYYSLTVGETTRSQKRVSSSIIMSTRPKKMQPPHTKNPPEPRVQMNACTNSCKSFGVLD